MILATEKFMKVSHLAVHLAAHLNRDARMLVELHRMLREGLTGADDLLPNYLDGDALELLGETAQKLIGKPGRGGGIEPDPLIITLLVLASLIDARRDEVAIRTLEVYAARPTGRDLCPLTRKAFFGEAFARIISDQKLAFIVDRIDVSYETGEMLIMKGDEVLSRFNRPKIERGDRHATHFVGRINGYGIVRLNLYLAGHPDFAFDLEKSKSKAE
jgi:hypothetical protein